MDRSARRLPVPTAGAETCGGVESFRLLICFQSCPPPRSSSLLPTPPTLYHLLLSHSLRSLVSWAICRTRWAGLTLSSSGRRRGGGEVRQSFIYCSDSSRALRSGTAARFLSQEAPRWKNAQISSGCSFEGSFHQASRSLGGKKRSHEDPKVFVLQQQRFFCGGGRSSWKTNPLKKTVFVILVRMFGEVLQRCVEHFT